MWLHYNIETTYKTSKNLELHLFHLLWAKGKIRIKMNSRWRSCCRGVVIYISTSKDQQHSISAEWFTKRLVVLGYVRQRARVGWPATGMSTSDAHLSLSWARPSRGRAASSPSGLGDPPTFLLKPSSISPPKILLLIRTISSAHQPEIHRVS